ncbi:hypothetical protein RM553_13165 [Zunongwangia sp. F363]|uniref:Uncharacterized protein n=1 Tax=Autumnicola tepida TaxID=3075595 RepID=A0ABU3CBT5_9FLAO|nr:hypothetical protein [Zunongwangia sp. F363]MDT0643786.1 hypothetical protein [Zunongwangia sp. F363]
MMKRILFFAILLAAGIDAIAQTPEKMSYQAVVRDNNNALIANSNISLKLIIHKKSPSGAIVYAETHNPHTNMNGLVSLQVGTGSSLSGSFDEIDWSHGPYFVESQVDLRGGSNFSAIGVSEMLSVPYALHAKTADRISENILESEVFEGWDTDASDDFDGNYYSLKDAPMVYTADQIDSLVLNLGTGGVSQSLSLKENLLSISEGNQVIFENWDTDATDDFSGDFNDLLNLPNLYTSEEVDSLMVNAGGSGTVQSLNLTDNELSISGGNKIAFENWDTDASDDFSGDFNDLINLPNLYTSEEVDSLMVNAGGSGTVQSLNLTDNELSISGGNKIAFENWDTDATDDFSGNYADLHNKPDLFSGDFNDLLNLPNLYTSEEVDSLMVNAGGSRTVQSLNLTDNELSISGGNSIAFENWDTDASDDFSGDFNDLLNLPNLYTSEEVDSLMVNAGGSGTVQSLNLTDNELSISGANKIAFEKWDTDASDDFSGNYNDLQNKPDLFSGSYDDLQNKPDLFSGDFNDLLNLPNLYTSEEVDSLMVNAGGSGTVQSLNLTDNELSISGGNKITFENWDTDATDDFSGNYADLQNKPDLFSGDFNDLINLPNLYTSEEVDSLMVNAGGSGTVQSLNLTDNELSISGGNKIAFENWDTDASDDFSGDFNDLLNLPNLYTSEEVDSLMVNAGGSGTVQSLNLTDNELSISGGNKIAFENWDTDATDDFDGYYSSLIDAPSVYTKTEIDKLLADNGESGGTNQTLQLNEDQLTISNGNTIPFTNWDRDVTDDFDGKYSSLKDVPKLYTQTQVDSIKEGILEEIAETYIKKPAIITFSSSRNIASADINNTIACTGSSTLTITSNFNEMNVGETINLEVHGTILKIKANSGVTLNGTSAGNASIGNNQAYTGGILRKTGTNSYIVL